MLIFLVLIWTLSIEIIILRYMLTIIIPQLWKISSGLQYYVDWEDETEKDIIQADIENSSNSEGDIK